MEVLCVRENSFLILVQPTHAKTPLSAVPFILIESCMLRILSWLDLKLKLCAEASFPPSNSPWPWPVTLSHHHEACHMSHVPPLYPSWVNIVWCTMETGILSDLGPSKQFINKHTAQCNAPLLNWLFRPEIASQLDDCVLIISDTMEISFIRQNQGCNPSPHFSP